MVIEPCTAAYVRVRVPRALCNEPIVAVEPLALLLEKYGCAALPSVYAPADSMFNVPVAHPSNRRVVIAANSPIAAIVLVAPAPSSTSTAASPPPTFPQ